MDHLTNGLLRCLQVQLVNLLLNTQQTSEPHNIKEAE